MTVICQQCCGNNIIIMSKNQYVSSMIFDQVIESTKACPHTLKHFQMRRPRLSLLLFWTHLNETLTIDEFTQVQASKIVWKLSNCNFKMSNNLMYKLVTACLMLAEKLCLDQVHTLESYSLVSGVSMKDLRSLEIQILDLLDFNLNLSMEEKNNLPQCLSYFDQ